MSEVKVPEIKMQLLIDEKDNMLIDFEPPLSIEQRKLLTDAHEFIDIPKEAMVFRGYQPKVGNAFTEIECAPIRAALAQEKIELNEQNLARSMAYILARHGDIVHFDGQVQPIAEGGYWFSGGLTTQRPPK